MIRAAFNMALRLHSRDMQIRRPGTPSMYSPARVSPSNYFRFLSGPGTMIIPRREFILSADSLLGEFAQMLTFSTVPTAGTFDLSWNGNSATGLAFDIDAPTLQTAIQAVTGLAAVLVSGDTTNGFLITFRGFSALPVAIIPQNFSSLVDMAVNPVTPAIAQTYAPWTKPFLVGDKIDHPELGQIAAADIELLPDLGGSPLGYRVRTE